MPHYIYMWHNAIIVPRQTQRFASVSLHEDALDLADKIRSEDPHKPSRAAVITAAVEFYAKKLGVEA